MKNIQIHGSVISGKWIYKSKIESRDFYYLQGKTLSPVPIIIPKAETKYSFPPVKRKDYENLFQNVLL